MAGSPSPATTASRSSTILPSPHRCCLRCTAAEAAWTTKPTTAKCGLIGKSDKEGFVVVFPNGISNRLACERSDVFKAISPVAGTDNTVACAPAQPVSLLHIHAKNDGHVLFAGGAGPDARDKSVITEFTSVPGTVEKWARLDGCNKPRGETPSTAISANDVMWAFFERQPKK